MNINRGFVGQGSKIYKENVKEAILEEGVDIIEEFDSHEVKRYTVKTTSGEITIYDPYYVTETKYNYNSGEAYVRFVLDDGSIEQENVLDIPKESIVYIETKVVSTICPCRIVEELNNK